MYIKGITLEASGSGERHTRTLEVSYFVKYFCVHDNLNRCNLIGKSLNDYDKVY
jgi:hypothetical protein